MAVAICYGLFILLRSVKHDNNGLATVTVLSTVVTAYLDVFTKWAANKLVSTSILQYVLDVIYKNFRFVASFACVVVFCSLLYQVLSSFA